MAERCNEVFSHLQVLLLIQNRMKFIDILFQLGLVLLPAMQSSHHIAILQEEFPTVEIFSFISEDDTLTGKIYLPEAYLTKNNLPAIFLIDFTEQHFKLATDEFEQVINGVQQIDGIESLVVSLENIPDIDAEPNSYQAHFEIYKNMAAHVDSTYRNNHSRTLIGKGSEAGIVLTTLFNEDHDNCFFENFIATDPSPKYTTSIIDMLENNDFPQNNSTKKLHFSFSTSNDRNTCVKLITILEEAKYPWLKFQSKEYKNSNYENTYPISFAEGLKYIFQNQ